MNILNQIKREDGYTVLETVVAMTLFVSVLIPLGVAVGDLMLDRTADQLGIALRLAETEMSHTMVDRDFVDVSSRSPEGYFIEKRIEGKGDVTEVRISIGWTIDREKSILVISKSFIDYR